jgi:predicted ester cyclase
VAADFDVAQAFFEACETGQGWDACAQYCLPEATFTAQSGAISDITTLSAYTDWMKGLLGILPDGSYEVTGFAHDAERGTVVAAAVFTGTHTGEGGPVPPTGKTTKSDYVYVIKLDQGKVSHMTKIWNDGWALKELGWA